MQESGIKVIAAINSTYYYSFKVVFEKNSQNINI